MREIWQLAMIFFASLYKDGVTRDLSGEVLVEHQEAIYISWGAPDVIFLHPGMLVTFPVSRIPGGVIKVDVPGKYGYQLQLMKFTSQSLVKFWTGKLDLPIP